MLPIHLSLFLFLFLIFSIFNLLRSCSGQCEHCRKEANEAVKVLRKDLKRKRVNNPIKFSSTQRSDPIIEQKYSNLVRKTNEAHKEFHNFRMERHDRFVEHAKEIPFGSHNRAQLIRHYEEYKHRIDSSRNQKQAADELSHKVEQMKISMKNNDGNLNKIQIQHEIEKHAKISQILNEQSKINKKLGDQAGKSFEQAMKESRYSKYFVKQQWKQEVKMRDVEQAVGKQIYQPLTRFEKEHKEYFDQKHKKR